MKKHFLICVLSFFALSSFGQSSDATLNSLNSSSIQGKTYNANSAYSMNAALINSKVNVDAISVTVQAYSAKLAAIAALANSSGYLRNDGSGNLSWTTVNSAAWGSITGTLSSQSDLQTALNLKANSASPTFTGTVTVPNPSNATDAANKAYVDNRPYVPLGTRYNQTYSSGTTAGNNLTKTGSGTTTYASNTLSWAVANSGVILTNETLTQNNYSTSLERWSRSATVKLNALNSHTVGFALGTTPIVSGTLVNQFAVKINSSTGAVTFEIYYGASAFTSVGTFAAAMSIVANDVMVFTVVRNVNLVTLILKNVTQAKTVSWTPDAATLQGPASACQMTMYNLGGSYDITGDLVSSEERKAPKYIFVGDSKTAGATISKDFRYADILFKNTDVSYVIYAISSNYIRGFDSNCIAEINEIAQGQATIIVLGGSNDKALGGDSDATIRTNLNALVTAVSSGAGAGNTVWVCRDTPRNGVTMSGIAANIATDYPSNNIDLYNSFLITGGTNMAFSDDGIHPNLNGHIMIADLITKSLGISGIAKQRTVSVIPGWLTSGTSTLFYTTSNYNALTMSPTFISTPDKMNIGTGTLTGGTGWDFNISKTSTSLVAGEVRNNSTGTAAVGQWRLSNATQIGLLGLTSSGYTPSGYITAGQTYVYGDKEVALVTGAANDILFAPNATEKMRIKSAGDVRILNTLYAGGLGTTPHSTIQSAGSLAMGYVAKTALYTLTASDYTVEVTSGTHTQTLPTAVGIAGREYFITNSGSGTVTVGTTSSQTFVNVSATPTTLTLAQFKWVTVVSNGANWLVKASN